MHPAGLLEVVPTPPHQKPSKRADADLSSAADGMSTAPIGSANLGAVETNDGGGTQLRRRRRPPSHSVPSPRRRRTESRWKLEKGADGKTRLIDRQNRSHKPRRQTKAQAEHDRQSVKQFDGPPEIPAATDEELLFRHSGWWSRRQLFLAALQRTGTSPNAMNAFVNCGGNAWLEETDDEQQPWKYHCYHCHSRWCLPCSRSVALNIGDNLKHRLNGETHLHIVLTMKHREAPLIEQRQRLYRCFKALRSSKLWKNGCDGGAAFFQCHTAKDGMWHPHLHIVGRGKWIPKDLLSKEWLRITGDSDNVGISRIKSADNIAREVTRYCARPVDDDRVTDPARLDELIIAMKGARLCLTFGKWRGFALSKRPPQPEHKIISRVRLADAIARADRGEVHWQHVLEILRRRANPSTAPPEAEHYL